MAIEQLLTPDARAMFWNEHFLKLPFALAGGCRHAMALGTRQTVEHLLARHDTEALASGPSGARRCVLPWMKADVERALAAGESLGVRHVHRGDAELAKMAADFTRDFLAPVDIHLYVTPANCAGFGWHYDAEDVFVLQTSGTKQWELRKNTVHPWPLMENLPDDMQFEKEIMPILRCTLEAGDWLYIPHGYWHRTWSPCESISLSVGLAMPTGMDVFDFLRPRLMESLRWRQRLNCAEEAQAGSHLAELGRDLARILADPVTAAAFAQRCRGLANDCEP